MSEAFGQAEIGRTAGEIPIGAVLVYRGEIIARAHNEVEKEKNACAHAEMLAIERASKNLSNWRLDGASLFVTLEPCTMCIGAMILARVAELYFSCYDPRQGATGSLYDLSSIPTLPHQLKVYPELMKERGEKLLGDFFAELRKTKR